MLGEYSRFYSQIDCSLHSVSTSHQLADPPQLQRSWLEPRTHKASQEVIPFWAALINELVAK